MGNHRLVWLRYEYKIKFSLLHLHAPFAIFAAYMKNDKVNQERPPRWFVLLLVLLALPLPAVPYLWVLVEEHSWAVGSVDTLRFVMYALPIYIVVSQWMSYRLYCERKMVAWILQAMLLLVYLFAALWVYDVTRI